MRIAAKIFRKILNVGGFNPTKKLIPERKVKNVTVVIDEKTPVIKTLLKALNHISEDFVIQVLNKVQNIPVSTDLIVFTSLSQLEIDYPTNKDVLKTFLITDNRMNVLQLKGKDLDLIFCKSFYQVEVIRSHVKSIHAFGVDYSSQYKSDLNDSISAELILKARKDDQEIKQTLVDEKNREFLRSPFWDVRYFSEQLRKGFNLFDKDKTRSITPINSNKLLSVGRHSFHNGYRINGNVFVSIGSFCSIGKDVSIYTVNHDTRYATTQGFLYRKYFQSAHPAEQELNPSKSRSKGPVVIKNDVIIYEGAKIMSGVTIGNGACIGAGAVVTKDVRDYEIVAGIPAKKVGHRYDSKTIEALMAIEWWNWSDAKITRNKHFFNTDLTTINDLHSIID